MRLAAVAIQSDNDRLSEVSARKVLKALEKLVEIDLLKTFEHQGKHFVYQWNWQKYQKVEYPRTTTMPRPSDVSLCDSATQRLFGVHPGGKRLPKNTGEVAEDLPNTSQEVAALAHAHAHPTANANGQRLEANGQRPTAVGPVRPFRGPGTGSYLSHANHAFCDDRGLCVPRGDYFERLVRKFSGAQAEALSWLRKTADAVTDPRSVGDVFKFYDRALEAEFGAKSSTARESVLDAVDF
jgi:hypothetical protein